MKLTVTGKSWLLTIAVAIALLAVMLLGLFTMKNAANTDNRARLEQIMKSTYSTIAQFEQMAASGKLDDVTAKQLAAQVLRENKYHPSEYVYVTDEKLVFVAAPLDPQIQGKRFGEVLEENVEAQLRTAINGAGGKMVAYHWTSKRGDVVAELLSIAQVTPRWGWVVGTGVSFDEASKRFWASAQWQVLICLLLTAAVGALMITTMRGLRKALGGEPDVAMQVARAIAAGDLTMQIDPRTPSASVLGAVATMQANLRTIIEGIQHGAASLTQASGSLNHQMDQLTRSSNSVSDVTGATAAAVEELSVSIDHISNGARDTTAHSGESARLASSGEDTATQAALEISKIAEQVADASQRITGLVERSQAIGGMATIIKEIADQTNLLALNAAIEAARAGEQGRGFSVVADEVRKLAERTTAATLDIANTIRGIQADTAAVVNGMESVTPQVALGVTMANQAAGTLRDISQAARQALEQNQDVARLSLEQSRSGAEIAGNVERIADMAQASALAVQQAYRELNRLGQLSSELENSVARFRL